MKDRKEHVNIELWINFIDMWTWLHIEINTLIFWNIGIITLSDCSGAFLFMWAETKFYYSSRMVFCYSGVFAVMFLFKLCLASGFCILHYINRMLNEFQIDDLDFLNESGVDPEKVNLSQLWRTRVNFILHSLCWL
jgi:hypothetical protein